jgi:hypothetical protein
MTATPSAALSHIHNRRLPRANFPTNPSPRIRLFGLTPAYLVGHGRSHLFRFLMHGRHEPAVGTAFFTGRLHPARYLLKPLG